MAKNETLSAFDWIRGDSDKFEKQSQKNNYIDAKTKVSSGKLKKTGYKINNVNAYYAKKHDDILELIDVGYNKDIRSQIRPRLSDDKWNTYTAFLEGLFATGARPEDLNNLKVRDLDFTYNVVDLKGLNKTDLQRVAPMGKYFKNLLIGRLNDLELNQKTKSHQGKLVFSLNGTNPISTNNLEDHIKQIATSQLTEIDPDNFSAKEINPITMKRNKVTYNMRYGTAIGIMNSEGFINPVGYIADNHGHASDFIQTEYNSIASVFAEERANNQPMVDLTIDERTKSAFDGHYTQHQRAEILKSHYNIDKNLKRSFSAIEKKQLQMTGATPNEVIKQLNKNEKVKLSEFDRALKEKIFPAGPQTVRQNIIPAGADEEYLQAIEQGKTPPKVVATAGEPVIPGATTSKERFAAKKVPVESRHLAIYQQQQKDAAAFTALRNKGNDKKIFVDLPMSVPTARQTIDGVFDKTDISEYRTRIQKDINELLNTFDDYSYKPASDYLQFTGKGISTWGNNRSLMDLLIPKEYQGILPATGEAAIKLDRQVYNDLINTIEYNSRVDTFAKKFIDQFEHLAVPDNMAKDYLKRTTYAIQEMTKGIDNYIEFNKDVQLPQAFDLNGGYKSTPIFMGDIQKRLSGVLLEQEFAPIPASDIDEVIKRNTGGQGFPFKDLDEKDRLKFTNNRTDNLINRLYIQPYLDVAFESPTPFGDNIGIIDNVVWEQGKEFAEDPDWGKKYAETLNYRKDGAIKGALRDYSINVRSTAFRTPLLESIASGAVTVDDPEIGRITTFQPIVDYKTEDGLKPKTKLTRFAEGFIDLTKEAVKNPKVMGTVVAGFGALLPKLAGAAVLPAEIVLETALIQPSDFEKGLFNTRYDPDSPEAGPGGFVKTRINITPTLTTGKQIPTTVDRNALNDFLGTLTPEEIAEYEDMNISKTMGVEPDTGGYRTRGFRAQQKFSNVFEPTTREEAYAPAVAATLIEGQDYSRKLREDAERDIEVGITKEQFEDSADALTGLPIAGFGVGALANRAEQKTQGQQNLARADEISLAKGDRDLNAVKDITAQMNEILPTNQQEGENDAVNARLQTR
tara:strand:- start:274 stop:3513 length:3240 start_codon:yes stop_codon:yes gene_type:complete